MSSDDQAPPDPPTPSESEYVDSSPNISNIPERVSSDGTGCCEGIGLGPRLVDMSLAELDGYFDRLIQLVMCEGEES